MFRKIFFNLWYYQAPPWDTGISPPELIDFIEDHSPGRALDLGCGSGTNVITLARYGWTVTGIDFARRAIRIAVEKAKQAGVKVNLSVGDVTKLNHIQDPFELILDIGCFHTLRADGKTQYANEVSRLLSMDGTYLMYGFCKERGDKGPGLDETDINTLTTRLNLVSRQDGSERGGKPSTWLTFNKYK